MLSRLLLIGFLSFLSFGVSFSSPSTISRRSASPALTTMFSTTEAPPMKAGSTNFPQYTDEQLKAALDSLLEGSTDKAFDGRHLFGFGDVDHTLSKLQAITATRILDYDAYLADPLTPSEEALRGKIDDFWREHGPILNLQKVIQDQSPCMALAAEFKRASPSKGDIAVHLNAGEQAQKYASAGANIISVLTEPRWFKGGLEDMTEVRLQTSTTTEQSYQRPAVLRKEFTTHKYQITEAIAAGADTILLIVAVLPQHLLKELIDHARSLGMEPLVEVHADSELEVAIQAGAKVIGVNNRNLHTFQMDLHTTEHVAELLTAQGCNFDHSDPKAEYTICSLSGMSTAFDVNRYRKINVGMCLIGESLMRAADPSVAIQSLCLDPDDFASATQLTGGAYTAGTKIVKICGVTNSEDAQVACQAGANLIGAIFVPKSKRCVTKEQAKSIVHTVRAFGERTGRSTLSSSTQTSPLNQLVANAMALEDVARRPMVVGVFQDQSPDFIREMVNECGLDMIQLHGKEGMEAANEELYGVPAIRVVDIETDPDTGKATEDSAERLLQSITKDPVAILLDTSIKGSKAGGGTGVTFDWTIAEKIQNAGLPVIIAGGLTPENVEDAVMSTRPWGVDVSSGTEASLGMKDHDKVKKFVGGARQAAIEASKGF